jgi:glycosyltransferase involved in cell wall biosynthesis
MGQRVQLIPRLPDQKSVYNIMEQVHCGVFPARAEGWNLEALEMLACGRDLIITDCTGHKEFANENNSKLIKMSDSFERAFDGVFFDGSRKWRKFGKDQFDQLVHLMREYHSNKTNKINESGVKSVSNLTWENSAKVLSNVF